MGTYYNPPSKLPEVARLLPVSPSASYTEAVALLRDDEVLFSLGDRIVFKNAPYLFSESEFNEFRRVYMSGSFVSCALYAMPVSVFREYFAQEPFSVLPVK